jgi:hypothetical protein
MPRSPVLLMVSILVACTATTHRPDLRAGDSGAGRNDADEPAGSHDPLVGTWTLTSGYGPNLAALTLTFGADKTCALVAITAPRTTPAHVNSGADAAVNSGADIDCKVTQIVSGTYVEGTSDGTKSLTWAMSSGTANAIVCGDPSQPLGGTPMTDATIDAYVDQGDLPPRTFKYEVDSTTLILTFLYSGNGLSIRLSRSPS